MKVLLILFLTGGDGGVAMQRIATFPSIQECKAVGEEFKTNSDKQVMHYSCGTIPDNLNYKMVE